MTRKMLINATHPEEHRVAIVEDGLLTELDIEIAGKEQTRGNIYKASIVRVESSLQAAFVDYGGERLGFLQLGEIHPSYYPSSENSNGRNRPRINEILRPGKELVVQVVKEERGTKGAALTTFLSLAGRYMVLMPESDSKGISRKIENESERKQIKQAMGSLELPDNMGYIVRTAGIGKSADELKRDFDYLVRIYRTIQERARQIKAPALIFRESNLIIRCIRDYFSEDMDEVLIDDSQVCNEAKDFFQMVMPEHAHCVKLHQERRPIFSRYQIEEQIETISQNKVQLPSGGSIVLDTTEALVAVDVNSGKMASEQGLEATAYKTNMEAAAETARQLRLRDLGGLIVIDFIDMRDRKHIREVEKCLKDALKNDKSRVTVGRISQFGLLEMSRQRLKPTLAAGAYVSCPHCQGSGRVKSIEAQGIAFLRRIQTSVHKGQIGRVEGDLPIEVALYLLNEKRAELAELERRYDLEIFLSGQDDLLPHESELNVRKREKQPEKKEEEDVLTPLEVAVIAETAPEPAAEETEESSAQAEGENQKRKRRRRRRRRKKDTGEAPAAAAEAEASEEPEETQEKPAEAPAAVPPAPPAEKPAAALTERSVAELAGQETASAPAQSPAPPEVSAESAKAEDATEKPQPKRRGGRRPARKTAAEKVPVETSEAPAQQESPGNQEEKPAVPAPATQKNAPATVEKATPAKKGESGIPQPAPANVATDSEQETTARPAGDQPPTEKEKKPARRRRTTPARKKTEKAAAPEKEKQADESAPETGDAASTEEHQTALEKPAPEKKKTPARSRRTGAARKSATAADRKTAKEPEAATDQGSASLPTPEPAKTASEKPKSSQAVSEKPAEDKPRKPAPRRKATTKTGTAAEKKAEGVEKGAEKTGDEDGAKKAPTRKTPQRRAPRKKKEDAEKETKTPPDKSSGEENSGEEK